MRYLDAHWPARNGANSYLKNGRSQPYTVDRFAHNALASGFRPRYFTDMYDEMDAAGLRYAGRTALGLNWTDASVPPAQVSSLLPYKDDARLRELLKDYIHNEQQRRDVFARKGSEEGEPEAFLAGEVALLACRPAANMARSLTPPGGETVPLEGPATRPSSSTPTRRPSPQ
ncbi:MAG: methyltransferase regulatory domain-containing protein [Thiohalorhabdus sp.]|uniref:methyltransferase regulatory domain-containing protein n=1 Tax=Thiohalorhabdus sp. TaxID=3094134 RepID=UPI002FC2DB4C